MLKKIALRLRREVVGQMRIVMGFAFVGYPAVFVAYEAYEEGARATDMLQAQLYDLALSRLLLGDAPAQVERAKNHVAPVAFALYVGKHVLDEVITLGMHIGECRRDEHADFSARICRGLLLALNQ